MRLGISRALKVPSLPEPAHLIAHCRDDVVKMRLFIRLNSFLGQFEAVVLASHVDEGRGYVGQKLAKEFVEHGTEEGIDSAFEVNKQRRGIDDPIEQPDTSVSRG